MRHGFGRFGVLGALSGVVVLLLSGAPARAVQTTTYGITPAPGTNQSGGNHLQATAGPGQSVHDQLLVYNRTTGPLTIDLSVVPAHLGPHDIPALGGSEEATHWVHLDQTVVNLGPSAKQLVGVTITLPRVLPHLPAQAAVLANPVSSTPGQVSVVIQLAVLISMNASTGAPGRAPIGTIGSVAIGVLGTAAVAGLVVGLVMRRRTRKQAA